MTLDVEGLQGELREVARSRDWERFHTPKNLAAALSVEEELVAVMGSPEAAHVREEVADVLIYLLRLADVLGVDLGEAVAAKLAANARRN